MIQLAFRIARSHVGKGAIETPLVDTQPHNPYWSYARHLPSDWDRSKADKRTGVATCLLLEMLLHGKAEIDLRALRDDQRLSGFVMGHNPLQQMHTIIIELAKQFPEYPFFAKWGGYRPELPGKRFVFYVDDEFDAKLLRERLRHCAQRIGAQLEDVTHAYGITEYQKFVKIDSQFKSRVENPDDFIAFLRDLHGFPHFFHEFFDK